MVGLASRLGGDAGVALRPASRGLDEYPLLYTSRDSTPRAFTKSQASGGGD